MTEKEVLEAIFKSHSLTEEELNKLHSHIEEHKYFVNENIPFTITFDQAIFSWYDNVFRFILNKCNTFVVRFAFPDYDCFQLYFLIVDHWHYMKKNDFRDELFLEDAVRDFVKRFSQRKLFGKVFYHFA